MASRRICVLGVILLLCGAHSLTSDEDDGKHKCLRPCEKDSPPMVCEYDFNVELYYVMSKACYACPFNVSDCYRPHCVAADGVERGVLTVNRQIPGPAIEVCEGDEIVVNVDNLLRNGEGVSIHWHGVHQRRTPYMDGVAQLTQCSIPAYTSFQYRFKADTPGTHFWHSHSGLQRADGLFGKLVIRQTPADDPNSHLYDFDLPEHEIIVTDWLNEPMMNEFPAHHHKDGDNKPESMLINGRGTYRVFEREEEEEEDDEDEDGTYTTPRAVFEVTIGKRYRFRMASNGILNCPIQFSIVDHSLLVIASDGSPLHRVNVASFVIYAGERFDFVLDANQPPGSYWMLFKGLADCGVKKAHAAAILRYRGAGKNNPRGRTDWDSMRVGGKQLNPLNTKGSRNLIPISNVKSLAPDDKSLNDPDMQLYLSFDFYKVDSTLFHDPSLYPIRAIEMGKHLYTPQVNHISAILPPSPPLTQYYDVPQNLICNETTRRNCDKEYCECVYMYKIPLGNVVEMVLIDEGVTFDASHPFHLHGYRFRVVAMDRVNKSGVTADDVRRLDREGLIARKLSGAPLKDTVTVPDGGYTIIRFHADNPGIWFFHCHIAFHAEIGMAVVLQVGEPTDFPYPPYKFPRCGDFTHTRGAEPPPGEEYLESIGRRNRARYGSHHTDSAASDKSLGCILAVFCCFCAFFRLT